MITIACHVANAVEERGYVDRLRDPYWGSAHRACLVTRFAEACEREDTTTAPCDCWCHQDGGPAVNNLPGVRGE